MEHNDEHMEDKEDLGRPLGNLQSSRHDKICTHITIKQSRPDYRDIFNDEEMFTKQCQEEN